MDANKQTRSAADLFRRELIASWKHKFADLHRRRWGKDLPAANARRILVVHDQTWSSSALERLRRFFGAGEALVDFLTITEDGSRWPLAGDYDCLVIATMEPPSGAIQPVTREFAREILAWNGFVCGIGGGAGFMSEAGMVPTAEEGSRKILEQDGRCFASAHREMSEELAHIVLERLAAARTLEMDAKIQDRLK